MICRRLWPPRRKHPPLYNRRFWGFGHDFLKSLQFVHDSSPYRLNSTPENYLLWRWNCKARSVILRSADGLPDTFRRSIPHNNYCTLYDAAGRYTVGKSYRKIQFDLGITENISISGKKFLEIIILNGISSVVRWEMFSGGSWKMLICKHFVNFSEKSPHFFKFPGRYMEGNLQRSQIRCVIIIIAPP